jgi:hypothetical protein
MVHALATIRNRQPILLLVAIAWSTRQYPYWKKSAFNVAEIWIPRNVKLSEFCLSRSAATRRHPAGVRTRVRTPCLAPSALHLGAIRGRMPRHGRHVSAERPIACVPRRNRPPTRLRARILAYIGTAQPAVVQVYHRPRRPDPAFAHPLSHPSRESGNRESPFPDSAGTGNRGPDGGGPGVSWSEILGRLQTRSTAG